MVPIFVLILDNTDMDTLSKRRELLNLKGCGPKIGLRRRTDAVLASVNVHLMQESYLVCCEFREQSLGLFIGNRWVHNDVVTLLPVHGSCDAMLVAQLKCCDELLVCVIRY